MSIDLAPSLLLFEFVKYAAVYHCPVRTDSAEIKKLLREVASHFDGKLLQIAGAVESPALTQVLDLIRRNKIEVLYVWNLDRLGRSLSHVVEALKLLRGWNGRIVLASHGLEMRTQDPLFACICDMLTGVLLRERDTVAERTRSGIEQARQLGARIGRPPRSPEIDPQLVIELRSRNMTWRTICTMLGASMGSVRRTYERGMRARNATQ